MGRLRWRYVVAVALAIYAFGYVFADSLFSPRTAFVFGVVLLFTTLGLWLRFRGPPALRSGTPAPPPQAYSGPENRRDETEGEI